MALLTSQHITTSENGGDGVLDVSYSALDGSTEKVIILLAYSILDAASPNDESIDSLTWDQGGNNESPNQITNAQANTSFAGDRYIAVDAWELDSPTATAGTLRIDAAHTGSTIFAIYVSIYEFDSEAETGSSGAVGTHAHGSDDPSITLSTRDGNSVIVGTGQHQVPDANPFTPGTGVTEDLDADTSGTGCSFAGHMDGTGGSDTFTYEQTTGRRNAAVAYEVLQSTGQTSPSVVLDSPADQATVTDSTPQLLFTGTDTEGDDVRYNVQICDQDTFTDGSQQGDVYEPGANFFEVHTQPDGSGNLDDRPGQSFTAEGGILDSVELWVGSDESDTDGTAYVRVYAIQGTHGTDAEPLDAAEPEDTPTSGWLAISDGVAFDNTDSPTWVTFNFSGDERIRLDAGTHYMWILDWEPNAPVVSTNNVAVRGSTDLGHDGNAYIDGASVNNGVYSSGDMQFRINEVAETLDKVSGTDSGFANEDSGGDTDPFNSGDQVSFTVQSADELENVTYFWRVRGIDPSGSNIYGSWTSAREFTVDAALSATVNQATETDTAQAISVNPIHRLVNQITETDTSQSISPGRVYDLGQSSETDLAQSLSALKTMLLGQSGETDLAQPLSPLKTVNVNIATESDLAQALTVAKTISVGQVSETDLAQSLSVLKTLAVGIASETDTALTISPTGEIVVAVGLVTESDTAQSITWAPKHRLLGQASEADTAQALTSLKTISVAQVTETNVAQALSALKTLAIGQASETDFAQPITTTGEIIVAVGIATEADLAQAITSLKELAIGQASESDVAQALTSLKTVDLAQATETDAAQSIAWAPKHRLVSLVTETDEAGSIVLVIPVEEGGVLFKGMWRGMWKKMQ